MERVTNVTNWLAPEIEKEILEIDGAINRFWKDVDHNQHIHPGRLLSMRRFVTKSCLAAIRYGYDEGYGYGYEYGDDY